MKYEDVEWHAAACKGIPVEMFYIESASEAMEFYNQMRKVCRSCPVYMECAEYAIENEHHGFWAGMTATERKQLRGRMHRAA